MTVTMPLTTFHNCDITMTKSHTTVITDSYNVVITTVLTEGNKTHLYTS